MSPGLPDQRRVVARDPLERLVPIVSTLELRPVHDDSPTLYFDNLAEIHRRCVANRRAREQLHKPTILSGAPGRRSLVDFPPQFGVFLLTAGLALDDFVDRHIDEATQIHLCNRARHANQDAVSTCDSHTRVRLCNKRFFFLYADAPSPSKPLFYQLNSHTYTHAPSLYPLSASKHTHAQRLPNRWNASQALRQRSNCKYIVWMKWSIMRNYYFFTF
jgi:hypothetical protein